MRVPGPTSGGAKSQQRTTQGLHPLITAARRSADESIDARYASDPDFRAACEDAETRGFLIEFFTELRKNRHWSQSELAKRLKTTQSAVSDFEKRVAEPRLPTLQRWARVFGYRLEVQLWEGPMLAFNSWVHRSLPYDSVVRAVKVDDAIARAWIDTALRCPAPGPAGSRPPSASDEQASFGIPVKVDSVPVDVHYRTTDELTGTYNRRLTEELERSL